MENISTLGNMWFLQKPPQPTLSTVNEDPILGMNKSQKQAAKFTAAKNTLSKRLSNMLKTPFEKNLYFSINEKGRTNAKRLIYKQASDSNKKTENICKFIEKTFLTTK